eukprot:SAG31_NODE_1635_length_7682_cov_5.457471_6_plen_183_part_00
MGLIGSNWDPRAIDDLALLDDAGVLRSIGMKYVHVKKLASLQAEIQSGARYSAVKLPRLEDDGGAERFRAEREARQKQLQILKVSELHRQAAALADVDDEMLAAAQDSENPKQSYIDILVQRTLASGTNVLRPHHLRAASNQKRKSQLPAPSSGASADTGSSLYAMLSYQCEGAHSAHLLLI